MKKRKYNFFTKNFPVDNMTPSRILHPLETDVSLNDATSLRQRRYTKSKLGGKDQESMQSSTRPEPGDHMGKRQQKKKTSHTREPRGEPFPSRCPQACNEHQESMTNTKHKL